MKAEGQLLPEQGHIPERACRHAAGAGDARGVYPGPRRHPRMGGEASGGARDRRSHRERPATVDVNDGGAGVRFNFPEPAPTGRFPGTNGSTTSTPTSARSCSTTTSRLPAAAAIASSRRRNGRICWAEYATGPDRLYSDLLQACPTCSCLRGGHDMRLHTIGFIRRGSARGCGAGARAEQPVPRNLEHHAGTARTPASTGSRSRTRAASRRRCS